MNMDYNTIYERCEAHFTEKRSEFTAYLAPCTASGQAISFIEEVRARHRKATHNVYAYILREGNTQRYSDDGEPQGTAGVPVLNVLQKNALTDICCVVTRYFGGILLGGGGLVRAYSHAAALAVGNARIMNMRECRKITVAVDYPVYGAVSNALQNFELKLLDSAYADSVTLSILVKTVEIDAFVKEITEVTSGRADISLSDIIFGDFA